VIFAPKYVFRVGFEGGFLGGAHNFWGNPYLNSTTILFDNCSEVDSSDFGCLPESSTNNLECSFDEVVAVLLESKFYWFEVIDKIIKRFDYDDEKPIVDQLSKLFPELLKTCQTTHTKMLLEQSYQAFMDYSSSDQFEAERTVNTSNNFF